MRTRIISSTCRRGWLALPLAALLLAGTCDRPEPTAIAAVEVPAPAEQSVVLEVAFVVDPASGSVLMLGEQAVGGGVEAALAVVLGTSDVQARATCQGCDDEFLDNQIITVHFTVRSRHLDGVDFRRTVGGIISRGWSA
jgi:hypothetical protein